MAQPATLTQTRPLFPSEPVDYMSIELDDGHLFIFDQESAQRSSGTLRVMIEAQAALDTTTESSSSSSSSLSSSSSSSSLSSSTSKHVAMKIADHGSRAVDGVLSFLYWRKRWINVVVEKIQDWPIPRENQALIQEMAVASHFLEV